MIDNKQIAADIMKRLGYKHSEEAMKKYGHLLKKTKIVEDDEAAIKGSDETGRSASDGSFPGRR